MPTIGSGMFVKDLDIEDEIKALVYRKIKKKPLELFTPQAEAIKKGLLQGENMIIAIPTATGKTLLGELAIMKQIYESEFKAIYAVPLKALAWEKYMDFLIWDEVLLSDKERAYNKKHYGFEYLSEIYEEREKNPGFTWKRKFPPISKVGISIGDLDEADKPAYHGDKKILVCSYEKLDSLIRHENPYMDETSILVIDEVHNVDDIQRGPTIEVIVARFLQLWSAAQIILLSATVSNYKEFKDWIGGKSVVSELRPIELFTGVYIQSQNIIKYTNRTPSIEKVPTKWKDPLVNLVMGTVVQGKQALVFRSTRKNAKAVARKIAKQPKGGRIPTILKNILNEDEYAAWLASRKLMIKDMMRRGKTKIDEELIEYAKQGVAFHHAGLDRGILSLIEKNFINGTLKILGATTTLAAGINLPAQRVIVREYRRFNPLVEENVALSKKEVKQMLGRAGRPKFDKFGEAILYVRQPVEAESVKEYYIEGTSEPVESQLQNNQVLAMHLLSTIALSKETTKEEIFDFLEKTLFAQQLKKGELRSERGEDLLDNILYELDDHAMIGYDGDVAEIKKFGSLISKLMIYPLTAITLDSGLFTMTTLGDFNQLAYLTLICWASPLALKSFLNRRERDEYEAVIYSQIQYMGIPAPPTATELEQYLKEELEPPFVTWLKCYKTSLVLNDWIEEESEDNLQAVYNVMSGDIARFKREAERIAKVAEIMLGFKKYMKPIEIYNMELRIRYGVKAELVDLVKLRGIGRKFSRKLFDNGIIDYNEIKRANVSELTKYLNNRTSLARSIKKQVEDLFNIKKKKKSKKAKERKGKAIKPIKSTTKRTKPSLSFDELTDEEKKKYASLISDMKKFIKEGGDKGRSVEDVLKRFKNVKPETVRRIIKQLYQDGDIYSLKIKGEPRLIGL